VKVEEGNQTNECLHPFVDMDSLPADIRANCLNAWRDQHHGMFLRCLQPAVMVVVDGREHDTLRRSLQSDTQHRTRSPARDVNCCS